ncbi:hypothetical protein [Devosia sp. A449]
MRRLVYIGAVLLVTTLVGVPSPEAQDTPFPATLDETYSGSLTVEVFPAQGGERVHRDTGTVEMRFSQADDGQIAFSTSGMIEGSGGFDLGATLQPGPDGAWREFSTEGMTQIDAAGHFLAIDVANGFETTLTGEISEQDGSFTLRRFPSEAGATSDDAAFSLIFSMEVAVASPEPDTVPNAGAAEAATGEDNGCKRVEWRLVNRWNPFGGAMRLDREPYCAQY